MSKSFDQVLREGGYTGEEAERVEHACVDGHKLDQTSLFLGTQVARTKYAYPMWDGCMVTFEGFCTDAEAIAFAQTWKRAEQELIDLAIKCDGDSLVGLNRLIQVTRPFAQGLGQQTGVTPPDDNMVRPVDPDSK